MTPLTTREKILKAASALFEKRGYLRANTKDIARKAKVNEATIFRTFGGKEKLFYAVIDWHSENMIAIDNLDRNLNSDDPAVMAKALARMFMATMTPGYTRIMLALATELPPQADIRFGRTRSVPFYAMVEQHITRLQQAGAIRNIDVRTAARALSMVIYGHAVAISIHSKQYLQGVQMRAEDIEEYVNIWLRGVATHR